MWDEAELARVRAEVQALRLALEQIRDKPHFTNEGDTSHRIAKKVLDDLVPRPDGTAPA